MRAERARKNRAYATGTGVVIVSLLALTLTVWALRPARLDVETLCPIDRPLAGHTLVILDRTDRWNAAMGDTLDQLIETAQRDTPQGGKFSIVSLDANQSTHPLFSVCNPGEPNVWSDIYRGRRYTARDFDERFRGAAENVIAQIRDPAEANSSPIVEYAHRWLGSDDFNEDVSNRRMILVSDMRQNSPAYSIYRGDSAALANVVQAQFGPAAQGVAFDVYFVSHGRDHNVTEAQVREAWDQAFRGVGATYRWRQIG